MWLFRSLKRDVNPFFSISPSIAFLLVVLQLAAWYPFLVSAYDEVAYQTKLKNRALKNWQKVQYQIQALESASFITDLWVTHQVVASKNGMPSQWSIEGTASLVSWQALLEYIEEQVVLSLSSVTWQRRVNGLWVGHLSFDVLSSSKDRVSHDWLPVLPSKKHFVEGHWELLSTLHADDRAPALLRYKQKKLWVNEGDWLPQIAMTVYQVGFGQVVLLAGDGQKITLETMVKED